MLSYVSAKKTREKRRQQCHCDLREKLWLNLLSEHQARELSARLDSRDYVIDVRDVAQKIARLFLSSFVLEEGLVELVVQTEACSSQISERVVVELPIYGDCAPQAIEYRCCNDEDEAHPVQRRRVGQDVDVDDGSDENEPACAARDAQQSCQAVKVVVLVSHQSLLQGLSGDPKSSETTMIQHV